MASPRGPAHRHVRIDTEEELIPRKACVDEPYQQRIRELERKIAVIDGCLIEVRDQLQGLPASDPARAGARTIVIRLMDARTTACRTLTALENGVALRPVQH